MRCCVLCSVCTVLVAFCESSENVWANVFKAAADLCAPTQNQFFPVDNSLGHFGVQSQMGRKSHHHAVADPLQNYFSYSAWSSRGFRLHASTNGGVGRGRVLSQQNPKAFQLP